MARRYEGWLAGVALRLAGLVLLAAAWGEGREAMALSRAHGDATPTTGAFLLAMLAYLSACGGAALFVLGRHLFDRVALSRRWAPRTPVDQRAIATFPPPL